MLVKDIKGVFYEVDEKTLKGKEVDQDKAYEAIAEEKAAKKKRIVDMLTKMDWDDISILRSTLFGKPSGRPPMMEAMKKPSAEAIEQSPLPRQWDCKYWDCKWWDCHWDCYWDCYWDCHWDCYWDCYWDCHWDCIQPGRMSPIESGQGEGFRSPRSRGSAMGPQGHAGRPMMRQRGPRGPR